MTKILKINKIKNLGLVFTDFSWVTGVPDFKPLNLIYGWNGCGKSTLSCLFAHVENLEDPNLEYELETDDSQQFTEGGNFPSPIRVFNQDYVSSNLRVTESQTNSISILLGEENKGLSEQIDTDEGLLNGDPTDHTKLGKLREQGELTQKKARLEKENEKAFTEIARTISAALSGRSGASRTYRAPNAKTDFRSLDKPALLDDDTLNANLLTIKQEMLDELPLLTFTAETEDGTSYDIIDSLAECIDEGIQLCDTTVEIEVIERLIKNPDIAEWIETGHVLHKRLGSEACEYCGNPISSERASQLAKHFNDEDAKLKQRIEIVLARLRHIHSALSRLQVSDEARLYQELRTSYGEAVETLKKERKELLEQITTFGKALAAKKLNAGNRLALESIPDVTSLEAAAAAIKKIIQEHNSRTRDFRTVQADAVKRVTDHYLSTIFDDVTGRMKGIQELDEKIGKCSNEIAEIRTRIDAARAQISSSHKACEQITDGIKTFLGHGELQFVPDLQLVEKEDGSTEEAIVGYKIMRGEQPATRLSEGEKTAIAFVFFVVHLNDGQFRKEDGIVVIDDPVSSLDSNSLYQAFSFLKTAVKDCAQVFVLTHNFDFLKLLLNWRGGGARKKKTGFYMIKNYMAADVRRATIDAMDKALKDYGSEYHYLFKRLKEMQSDQDGTIMRAYPVPNIARKVWDSFLMYRVPNGKSPYEKMEALKEQGYDAQKLDAIYKFTNDQSHITGSGFDPSLVPETQKVLSELFEMMERIAPEHYSVLEQAVA